MIEKLKPRKEMQEVWHSVDVNQFTARITSTREEVETPLTPLEEKVNEIIDALNAQKEKK